MYGMLTLQEIEYLRKFASVEYSGQGAIVDLGIWFGMSTVALATGLREQANSKLRSAVVHAYDLFTWEAWMDGLSVVRGTPLEGKYRPGDSFLEECRVLTEPWKDSIRLHPGDLSVIGWPDGAIEFLFVDAMKSWALANSIIHDFYPSLIPGTSVVVQQDFGNFYCYWIHLTTYRFRECFQAVYDISYSSSVAFKYVLQLPAPLMHAEYDLSSFSGDEIDAAFAYATSLVGPEKQPHIAAAKLRCCLDKGDRDRVQRAFVELSTSLYAMPYAVRTAEATKLQQELREMDRWRSEAEGLRSELKKAQALRPQPSAHLGDSLPQRESDPLSAAIDQARVEMAPAEQARIEHERQVQELHVELRGIREALANTQSDLDLARLRIAAMESSRFWTLRRIWFRIKRALHLSGSETA